MRLRLVHGTRGNVFLREILEAVAFEARELGVDAEVVDDRAPDEPDVAYVVMPHEYFAVVPRTAWLTPAQLARTIALNVEHPGTPWFELAAQQALRCARVFDINDDSAFELNRRGLSVERFHMGYTEAWRRWDGGEDPRPHDVVYLAGADDRRDRLLAGYAHDWWDLDTQLRVTTNAPRRADTEGFLHGAAKYDLLTRTKVLVNLHRTDSRALEWVRVVEAMLNGCAVVTEHSLDAAPLVPDLHYVTVRPEAVGGAARELAQDPRRLADMRHAAIDLLRTRLPLAEAVTRLVSAAADLVARPVPGRVDLPEPPPATGHRPPPWPTGPRDRIDAVGAAVARLERRVAAVDRERRLERLGAATPRDAQETVARTPAFADAAPRVSILVPMFRHGHLLATCLDSVAATTGVAFEILVQDDGSDDDSLARARDYLAAHPELPVELTASRVNNGVSATRNLMLERVRGEYVLPVDADNGVFPTALAEFVAALDAAPAAAFAYAPIVVLRSGVPQGLISAHPWDPKELRYGNTVDTMALIRTATLRRFGGWDPRLTAWEDFHLWLRMAEAGEAPVFIPKALTWYRTTEHSLRMTTGHDDRTLWSHMREAAPGLYRDLL